MAGAVWLWPARCRLVPVVRNKALSPTSRWRPRFSCCSAWSWLAPIAVVMSLMAVSLPKLLHRLRSKAGHSLGRGWKRCGGQQLIQRIQREHHRNPGHGSPSEECPERSSMAFRCSTTSIRWLICTPLGCDAVAVTSDGATRCNYLQTCVVAGRCRGRAAGGRASKWRVTTASPHTGFLTGGGAPCDWRRHVKRAGTCLTSFGLVVVTPVLLGIAAFIKLQDRGPVIFRQTRVGRGSNLFT